MLSQRRSDGKEQPVAYYSRSLKKAERNYSVYDREALAAVEAILHFRPLLHNGRPFTLETDHSALQYILNPDSELRTKRQERYVTVLQEYPVRIVHRPGDKNANADAFSRLVASEAEDAGDGAGFCPRCGARSVGPAGGGNDDGHGAPAAVAQAAASAPDAGSAASLAAAAPRAPAGAGASSASAPPARLGTDAGAALGPLGGLAPAAPAPSGDDGGTAGLAAPPAPLGVGVCAALGSPGGSSATAHGHGSDGDHGTAGTGSATGAAAARRLCAAAAAAGVRGGRARARLDDTAPCSACGRRDDGRSPHFALAADVIRRAPGAAVPPAADAWGPAQRADELLGELMQSLENGVGGDGDDMEEDSRKRERFRAARLSGFYVSGGRLYTAGRRGRHMPEADRLVVPTAMIPTVLAAAHDLGLGGGHIGFDRTYAKVCQRFFWDGMYADTAEWVLRCPVCLARKMTQFTGIPVRGFGNESISYPFEFVGVDVVGPLPRSRRGNLYLVVFTDYLTRWVEAFATVDHTARTVARLLLEEIVPRHGAPRVLLSDNGAEFRSALVKEVTGLIRTEQRHSSPYHPQCNGLTERANGSIVALLSLLVDSSQDDWDACLGMALFSHRSAVNVTMGVSPFRMLYGREAVLPLEAMARRPRPDLPPRWKDVADYVEALQDDLIDSHDLVREFLHNQQQLREAAAAAPRHETRRFHPGERVWVYRFLRRRGLAPKLTARRWFGPYVVVRRLPNSDTYEVRTPNGQPPAAGEPMLRYPWVHAIRLRPYRVRAVDMPAPEPPSSSSTPAAAPRRAPGRRLSSRPTPAPTPAARSARGHGCTSAARCGRGCTPLTWACVRTTSYLPSSRTSTTERASCTSSARASSRTRRRRGLPSRSSSRRTPARTSGGGRPT